MTHGMSCPKAPRWLITELRSLQPILLSVSSPQCSYTILQNSNSSLVRDTLTSPFFFAITIDTAVPISDPAQAHTAGQGRGRTVPTPSGLLPLCHPLFFGSTAHMDMMLEECRERKANTPCLAVWQRRVPSPTMPWPEPQPSPNFFCVLAFLEAHFKAHLQGFPFSLHNPNSHSSLRFCLWKHLSVILSDDI